MDEDQYTTQAGEWQGPLTTADAPLTMFDAARDRADREARALESASWQACP
jgi:hypothetical protein